LWGVKHRKKRGLKRLQSTKSSEDFLSFLLSPFIFEPQQTLRARESRMMKKEVFPDKEIQGLLPRRDSEATYWTRKAKVDLASFKEENEKNE
jgi:hypothetical protein